MAYTTSGSEFHILLTLPEAGSSEAVEGVVRGQIRDTDGVFIHSGDIFIAVHGGVPAAARAAKRLMRAIRDQGLAARVLLVEEPFPPTLGDVAYGFINEQVPVRARTDSKHALQGAGFVR